MSDEPAAKRRKDDEAEEKKAAAVVEAPPPVEIGKWVGDLISELRTTVPESAKEVFLWELLRNASNALLQLRFESLVHDEIHGPQLGHLFISIVPDSKNGTLTIFDNGIGMSKTELQNHLCDIPEPALKKYLQNIPTYATISPGDPSALVTRVDLDLRLGFFSAYMVADKVVVTTNKTRGSQFVWTGEVKSSNGRVGGSCTIVEEDTSGGETGLDRMRGGTSVTLFLNKNLVDKYTDKTFLINLTKKYVEHLMYPVYISVKNDDADVVDDHKTKEEIYYNEKKQKEERDVTMDTLKPRFEKLRALVEKTLGSRVEGVDLDDGRVPELANYLSSDKKRFVINPRSPMTEEMRQMLEEAEAGDDEENIEDVKDLVELYFDKCLNNIWAYDNRNGTKYYNAADLDAAEGR